MKDRTLAAKLAEDYYSEKIDYRQFMMDFPENEKDEILVELFDLIEHEPKVGIFGESQIKHDSRIKRIKSLIEELKK